MSQAGADFRAGARLVRGRPAPAARRGTGRSRGTLDRCMMSH